MAAPAAGRVSAPARVERAVVLAVVAVALACGLRADSDGALPSLGVVLACVCSVTLAVLPLTGRERRLPALLAALAGSQLVVGAVLLLAARGTLARPASTAWVCCPPSPAAHGLVSSPTATGGLLLLVVQLLGAALLAGWLRGVESAIWSVAGRLADAVLPALAAVLARLITLLPGLLAAVPGLPRVREADRAPAPRNALIARTHPRRGPPLPQVFSPGRPVRLVPAALPTVS